MLNPAKHPACQNRRESLSSPAGCRNTWSSLSPQRPRSAQYTTDAPGGLLLEYGQPHGHSLELRHRRIPEEREVDNPDEANAPEEEGASEQDDASDGEESTSLG